MRPPQRLERKFRPFVVSGLQAGRAIWSTNSKQLYLVALLIASFALTAPLH